MRRLVLIAALLALGAPSAAGAQHRRVRVTHPLRLLTPTGAQAGEPWQRWISESRVSTGTYALVFDSSLDCRGARGCSTGWPGSGVAQPETNVGMAEGRYLARDALYFELGHQFDWHFLTDADRRYLARVWGAPHARWWDSAKALQENAEDGLEADFAVIYGLCAWGESTEGAGLLPLEPDGATVAAPAVYPTIDTCPLIDRLARVRVAR